VLTIIPYDNDDHAVEIANDSEYGLAAYVSSSNSDRAREIGRRLRAGQVRVNGASGGFAMPFGGYKKSGIGREWGAWGLEEFLETKALIG
jgi:acyl-CoA reductase-like NAD-dependent aldehyde dehydrogenase